MEYYIRSVLDQVLLKQRGIRNISLMLPQALEIWFFLQKTKKKLRHRLTHNDLAHTLPLRDAKTSLRSNLWWFPSNPALYLRFQRAKEKYT